MYVCVSVCVYVRLYLFDYPKCSEVNKVLIDIERLPLYNDLSLVSFFLIL